MLGPIVLQELRLGSRRTRLHVLRWLYAGWLIVLVLAFGLEFLSEEAAVATERLRSGGAAGDRPISAAAVVGERFVEWFLWQQWLLLFLTVPVFVAGAVIDEKRRGTLQYLLLSELEPRHILIGKWIGRVALVGLWLLVGWPLFAVFAGLTGVPPLGVVFFGLGLGPPVYGIAAISVLASVWCRETRDAVLLVYCILLVGAVLSEPIGYLNPRWVLDPAWGPPATLDLAEAARRLGIAAALWLTGGTFALVLAIRRLRPSYRSELERAGAVAARWLTAEREPVSEDPIRWRVQHVEGLAPNAMLRRIPLWLGVSVVFLLTTLSSLAILFGSLAPTASGADLVEAMLALNLRYLYAVLPGAGTGLLVQAIAVMLLASLVVGVRCAAAITQERERQTWEAVLLTPVTARAIVHGKLHGVLRASGWYLLAYAAPAVTLAAVAGPGAVLNTVLWLGVTLVATYFIGAAGLWCSVRSRNSWRSLLQTIVVGYLGVLLVYVLTSPVIGLLALLLALLLSLIDLAVGTSLAAIWRGVWGTLVAMYATASAVGLVVIFWGMAQLFLRQAQRWIADRDRTRSWRPELPYRRRRAAARSQP